MIDVFRVEFPKSVLEVYSLCRPEPVDQPEEVDLKGGEVRREIIRRKINRMGVVESSSEDSSPFDESDAVIPRYSLPIPKRHPNAGNRFALTIVTSFTPLVSILNEHHWKAGV